MAKSAGVVIGPGAGIHVTTLDGLVRAIGAFGAVRTIAAPQILAMNNQPAMMRIGAAPGPRRRERSAAPCPPPSR